MCFAVRLMIFSIGGTIKTDGWFHTNKTKEVEEESILATKLAMYPKLKVEHEVDNCKQKGSCLNSNNLQSRVSENNNQEEDDSKIYVAKIPKIYIPSVLIPNNGSSEMNKRTRGAAIEVKPKTKTSPVLRPRAVVSSPDNDAMIGSINRSEERKAKKGLKTNDQNWSRGTNVKISHKQNGVSSRNHK